MGGTYLVCEETKLECERAAAAERATGTDLTTDWATFEPATIDGHPCYPNGEPVGVETTQECVR